MFNVNITLLTILTEPSFKYSEWFEVPELYVDEIKCKLKLQFDDNSSENLFHVGAIVDKLIDLLTFRRL